jgi:hypothetical protein
VRSYADTVQSQLTQQDCASKLFRYEDALRREHGSDNREVELQLKTQLVQVTAADSALFGILHALVSIPELVGRAAPRPIVAGPRVGRPRIGRPRIGRPRIGRPRIGRPRIGRPRIGRRLLIRRRLVRRRLVRRRLSCGPCWDRIVGCPDSRSYRDGCYSDGDDKNDH